MEFSRLKRFSSPLVLACCAIAALWLPLLHRSLWLDELQTAWVVGGTLHDTASRAFHTQGFTPFYYFILWALRPILGMGEIGLRLPSLLLTLGSALLVYRLGRALLPAAQAALAVLFFVCIDSVIDTAVTARPYALALFFSLLSMYSFERWLCFGLRRHKFTYVVSTICLIYAHFLFAAILALEFLYWALFRSRSKVRAISLVGACLYIFIGLVPTIPQIQSMLIKRALMAIARMPTLSDLILNCLPWLSLVAVVIAYFLAVGCTPKEQAVQVEDSAPPERRLLVFLALWAVMPAFLLFAASYFLGSSVFMPRYFEWASPGVALFGAALMTRLKSERARLLLPVFFTLFCVISEFTKDREPEDWRSATTELQQLRGDKGAPLLFYSGVVESSNAEWLTEPIKQGQFLSPILYYRVAQPVFLLPFEFSSEQAKTYWARTVIPRLPSAGPLYLLLLDNLSWTDEQGRQVTISEEVVKMLEKEGFALK
ncbi:MAG: glycosyltransferase family 39 protein, partial [Deltaproteobacteria bacterium]|nr:glycosyltransferase family 39 protein [Deltaproteobacteria bacterium]